MKNSMSAHVEGKWFSSMLTSDLSSQTPQGTEQKRARRRRKKATTDGDYKKRRLSDEQVRFLEMSFGKERKLESGRKVHIAAELGLDPKQVAVWFQNRRARHKSKQVEDAYLKLKTLHDAAVLEKCHLENEVLRLKGQLREAEVEIRKLSVVAGDGGVINVHGATSVFNNGGFTAERSSGSPASSFSNVTQQPMAEVEFGAAEGEAAHGHHHLMSYAEERNYGNCYMMEWPNIYDM